MTPASAAAPDLVRRHLLFGWWLLLAFLSLGIVLDAMHGLKIGWYLDTSNEARRLMWTLAHAHGTLIALIHLAFAASLKLVPAHSGRWPELASPCLISASFLMPGGFFLGGIVVYAGDPGLGVLLVPLGAVFLFAAVLFTALHLRVALRAPPEPPPDPPPDLR